MQLAAPNRARCQRRLAFLRIAEVFALDIAFYRTRLIAERKSPPRQRKAGWGARRTGTGSTASVANRVCQPGDLPPDFVFRPLDAASPHLAIAVKLRGFCSGRRGFIRSVTGAAVDPAVLR